MPGLLFDNSAYLGQFCLDDESIRMGCKNVQVGLMSQAGSWIDLENGRADKTIWSIRRDLQDVFYPYMDRFFSLARVEQIQMGGDVEHMASALRQKFPALSFYSRMNLATAIAQKRDTVCTLFEEMFDPHFQESMLREHGIKILNPSANEEAAYKDAELEDLYQKTLTAMKKSRMDLLRLMADERRIYK